LCFIESYYLFKNHKEVIKMRELTAQQSLEVSAGFKINIGHAIAAIATGIITGGPVGLGLAIGAIIISQGVNSLEEICNK